MMTVFFYAHLGQDPFVHIPQLVKKRRFFFLSAGRQSDTDNKEKQIQKLFYHTTKIIISVQSP